MVLVGVSNLRKVLSPCSDRKKSVRVCVCLYLHWLKLSALKSVFQGSVFVSHSSALC